MRARHRRAVGRGDDRAVYAPSSGGPQLARRPFFVGLVGITLVGLAVRVAYVLLVTVHENAKLYDAFWYGVTADDLAHGRFFVTPFGTAPTAAHSPMTSFLLAVASVPFGGHASLTTRQHLTMAVLGAAVVFCVGLVGRAVAGGWVGLVAAGLAAVVPTFWIPSGILMSETPSMLGMALILLAILRLVRSPTWGSAALLGLACGFEVLVRAELILLLPVLLVPAAFAAGNLLVRRRLGLIVVGVSACAVVLAPWVARNLASFDKPTYVSSGIGGALLGSNCPAAYAGPGLGNWHQECLRATGSGDESVISDQETQVAVTYVRHHAGRLPVVVLARIGRLWDVYAPDQGITTNVNEGRPAPAARAGLVVYYLLVPIAAAGFVLLRRRGRRPYLLLLPAGVLTVVSALFYGTTRFRAPFEVCLVVLAAPALVVAAQALARRVPATGQAAAVAQAAPGVAPPAEPPTQGTDHSRRVDAKDASSGTLA